MRLHAIAYYADFFLAGATALALFIATTLAVLHGDDGAARIAALIATWVASGIAGLGFWSLAEYAIHRFLYHRIRFFDAMHDAHHAEPDAFIGGPPVIGIVLIFAVGYLPFFMFSMAMASGFTAGLLTGYMGYMLVHHADHYWKSQPASALYRLRRHHALHHYHSEECNFGIVTSFWDHVFGTALKTAGNRASRHPA